MRAAEVEDILDEMDKINKGDQTSANVDESAYFPQGESFDSVEELRERIQEEKNENSIIRIFGDCRKGIGSVRAEAESGRP